MNAAKISHTVLFEKPESAQWIASPGQCEPAVAACSGDRYTWFASTATTVIPIRPIAPPGNGSSISPTMTPANIAKYHQANCGKPRGAGISARRIVTATGAIAFQKVCVGAGEPGAAPPARRPSGAGWMICIALHAPLVTAHCHLLDHL